MTATRDAIFKKIDDAVSRYERECREGGLSYATRKQLHFEILGLRYARVLVDEAFNEATRESADGEHTQA